MISIRRATNADVEALVRLNQFVHDVHREQRPDQFHVVPINALHAWYEARLSDPVVRCWIAERDDQAVGYVLAVRQHRDVTPFTPERHWYEIDQLGVDPAHRRQGIGGRLIAEAIDAARGEGIETIELSSWSFNAEMHGLLRTTGFVPKVIRFERISDRE